MSAYFLGVTLFALCYFRSYQYSDGFLSIMGLELPPSLAELVKNGDIGLSNEPELCQRAAAALGYVAHFVNLCSKYLDIPLRYPIKHWGSMSLIYNWATSVDRSNTKSIQGRKLILKAIPFIAAGTLALQFPMLDVARKLS